MADYVARLGSSAVPKVAVPWGGSRTPRHAGWPAQDTLATRGREEDEIAKIFAGTVHGGGGQGRKTWPGFGVGGRVRKRVEVAWKTGPGLGIREDSDSGVRCAKI